VGESAVRADGHAFSHVTYERLDTGVALLTLNEPARLNAIDHGPGSMGAEILAALAQSDADASIGVTVVTGAGRAFSAGGDPGGRVLEEPDEWYDFLRGNAAEAEQVRNGVKPVIGAVNGICYGYGMILTTYFDIVLAADSARFGLIETRFGSTGAQTLAFVVGLQWAKFLALSGELISARRAKEIGLVLETFPEDQLLEKALDLGRRVAAMPREAVILNRRVVNSVPTIQGWDAQRELALGVNALTNLMARNARGSDGRILREIREKEGWDAYKQARDAAFAKPWLEY
jgi:enoyl-CoA hydratase/carnithine racemase